VLVSVLLFVLAGILPFINLAFAGIGSGVSTTSFLILCAMATATSLVAVIGYCARQGSLESKRKALVVDAADNDAGVLEKALRGATGEFQPVTVITLNQERFVGSLMAPTSNGGIALVGWFALELANGDPRRQQLEPLFADNRLLQALRLAATQGITPVMRNPVRALAANGTLAITGDTVRRFRQRDILESAPGEIPGFAPEPPLVLVAP
jgi:hypothetical protein